MSARARAVEEELGVFLETIPGGNQEEVTSRAVRGEGRRSLCRGGDRVEGGEYSGMEVED